LLKALLIPAKITIEKKRKCVCEREREYFKAVLYGLIKIHLLSFECQNVITTCWCKTKRLRLPHLTFERKTTKLSSQTDKAETKRMGTIAVPRFRIKQAKRECNWSFFFSSIGNKLRTQEQNAKEKGKRWQHTKSISLEGHVTYPL